MEVQDSQIIEEELVRTDALIALDSERKYITYTKESGKSRNYTNPEEQVQAETYIKLIREYGYSPQRVKQFVRVSIGSTDAEADIIVYNDDGSAHIVVECKKEEVSEMEFERATAQAFSYAATGTVRAKYFWVTSKIKNAYFEIPEKEPKKRIPIPNIPNYGKQDIAKYRYIKGGEPGNEISAVTQGELIRRFKQAHNALWGGGQLNPSQAFDELNKLIFCKIWDEKKHRAKGDAYDFQISRESTEEKTKQELEKRIHALYEEGRKKSPDVFRDDIRLSREKLRTVVGYLESINLNETDLDVKGQAFESFMGPYFRGEFGQYFTPKPIVEFVVDVLPIDNESLVLDTSCGSGRFLLHALDKVRKQANEKYPNFETDPKETTKHKDYWYDFAQNNLCGIEINEQIARSAKMNMIIHDDGRTNVVACDGLLPLDASTEDHETIYHQTGNRNFQLGHFDFVITNPPFGASVRATEKPFLQEYDFGKKEADWLNPKSKPDLRPTQSTEILFIEQCHNFLKEGGYLAIVIPDSILTNSTLQYVRDSIEDKYRIVAVVSIPQTAFHATGAGVKSSVLFLKKHPKETTQKIQTQKIKLQDQVKAESSYLNKLNAFSELKKQHVKTLKGFDNPEGLSGKKLTQSESYKEWKNTVDYEYRRDIEALKEGLRDKYLELWRKTLDDYPIFMAIAENIGYDATGKKISGNELPAIRAELARFIGEIQNGRI